MSASEMSHEWCEVSLKIDRATAVTMSRMGERGHKTKRKDETIHTTTWTTHHQTPQRSTTQHSTSWRSATDAILPGNREHTGGSRQDTHGTPVLITIRRPWVAQPHEHAHATEVTDTQAVNKGGDQTAWKRSTWQRSIRSMLAEQGCRAPKHPYMEAHPYMVAEQSYVPQQSTMVHTLADHLTSLPRRDQDEKR